MRNRVLCCRLVSSLLLLAASSMLSPMLAAGASAGGELVANCPGAGDQALAPASEAIRQILANARHPILKWGSFPDFREPLQRLYAGSGDNLIWSSNRILTRQASAVIDGLSQAEAKGLRTADYDVEFLRARAAGLCETALPEELAIFDTALSISLMRYLSSLHRGRINPRSVGFDLDVEPKKYDLAKLVQSMLEEDGVVEAFSKAEPQLPFYESLIWALARYRQLSRDPDLRAVLDTDTVHPGDHYDDINALSHLLTAVGDYATDDRSSHGDVYEGDLVQAIMKFQHRHGLAEDGIIGSETFRQLNVPLHQRVEQIRLSLERLRWLPEYLDGPVIGINIPGFTLRALDPRADDFVVLKMNAIVGQAINKWRTPVLAADMHHISFRPYWNVPQSIAIGEILPTLRRNAKYFETERLEIVDRFSDDATIYPLTDETVARLESGLLRLRQQPGPSNALGLLKFIFPNMESVYLHGTPERELFRRSRRDFSHGCIRIEDPVALAEFVLGDNDEWTRERIAKAMRGSRPLQVNLKNPIPVYIFYTTVVADRQGQVFFFDDIYGHDATLKRLLDEGFPYSP